MKQLRENKKRKKKSYKWFFRQVLRKKKKEYKRFKRLRNRSKKLYIRLK